MEEVSTVAFTVAVKKRLGVTLPGEKVQETPGGSGAAQDMSTVMLVKLVARRLTVKLALEPGAAETLEVESVSVKLAMAVEVVTLTGWE